MNPHNTEIIEEVESRRYQLNLTLLRIYNYYRVFIGSLLLLVFIQNLADSPLGSLNSAYFLTTCLSYIGVNLVISIMIPSMPIRLLRYQGIPFLIVLADTFALGLLMYYSGGVSSGLAIFIMVSVAAGAILVTGRSSTLLAASASIIVLYEEFYLSLSAPDLHDDYFIAGVMGILYFSISITIQYLSNRLRKTEVLSLTRAVEVEDLERINRSIIQRMRTGLILVNHNNSIRMINQSAKSLLGYAQSTDISELPTPLLHRLDAWRKITTSRTLPFQVQPTTPEILINFSAVRANEEKTDVVIFLEDTAEMQQQAQQLKLAELGRLSANIAHEIRNPLGAISHAAQLLGESSNLDAADTRLTEIIYNHCKRMNDVVENILNLSRRGQPNPVRINLLEWVIDFTEQFNETNDQTSDIQIEVHPANTEIRIDPSQLSQVITNLVTNGLRYSRIVEGQSKIRLEGGIDETTDRPYLSVIDFGPGIEESLIPNLFEPFFTTEASGTGLGLYLARELSEANQARLTYSKDSADGSCFRVTFAHPDRITA
ncbi:MAG: PAS domain-containing sensor histidine kinase [Pseudomonadales bacterium]|nr:PAS domain-containing sensor histidine kinase [Pseudomonadales bacterium]